MITVYYDGKCKVCLKEIEYYQRIAPKGVFYWLDLTDPGSDLKGESFSLVQAMKQLHVKDRQGAVHVGVDAFITIWRELGRWRLLANVVSLPLFYQLSCVVYKVFAQWRFKRLKHCQISGMSKG